LSPEYLPGVIPSSLTLQAQVEPVEQIAWDMKVVGDQDRDPTKTLRSREGKGDVKAGNRSLRHDRPQQSESSGT
jgi:hypothetical protein